MIRATWDRTLPPNTGRGMSLRVRSLCGVLGGEGGAPGGEEKRQRTREEAAERAQDQ